MPEAHKHVVLWASSGFGYHSKKPFVAIHWKDVVQQMSPESAREFALNILCVAEAAEQDAFIVSWAQQEIGADDSSAARLLQAFRQWRAKQARPGGS